MSKYNQKNQKELKMATSKTSLAVQPCSYCKKNIAGACRIKCAVCVDFTLCADCFCSGVNLDPHVNTHSYRPIDALEYPIFAKDWSAREELLLLDCIEKYGAGNWKTISEIISQTKLTSRVEEHYWEKYMGVHGSVLPAKTYTSDGDLVSTANFVAVDKLTDAIDLSACDVVPGYVAGEEVVRDRTKDVTKGNKERDLSTLPGADLPGYMPLRRDFDTEYENDAEVILAELEFNDDDHPSERELKLQVIRIYNAKLAERNRRKDFAVDRGLVDLKKQQLQEKRLSKEDKALVARLKVFARFQSQEEHEALVAGILRAKKLRHQLELFRHYRAMGLRTLEQVKKYETDRKKKDGDVKGKKLRDNSPYLFEATSGRVSGAAFGSNVVTSTYNRRRGSGVLEDGGAYEDGADILEAPVPLSLEGAPGSQYLNQAELTLCEQTSLLPMHFLAIKEALVR